MSNARLLTLSGLLAFIGGFIDVVCFFGLKGLLAAHITGNLATLCASIVLGTAGLISKIVAVPEFMIVVAFAHMTARILKRYGWPAVRILLGFEAVLLTAFLALAVRYGPFADPDSDVALVTALAAIAAMAVQNAVQRAQLTRIPPTSFMTGNATQASIDMVDTLAGAAPPPQQERLRFVALNLACFALGCAAAALAYDAAGFMALAITVPVAVLAVILAP
jgi:uncharacterized membrane protein YoaK (UPF0700 family)